MKIEIITDGKTKNTKVYFNGKEINGLEEFSFCMNPHKQRKNFIIEGKCKMGLIFKDNFSSYFADDFIKLDEIYKKQEEL